MEVIKVNILATNCDQMFVPLSEHYTRLLFYVAFLGTEVHTWIVQNTAKEIQIFQNYLKTDNNKHILQ
jgi:hypothetical protein